MNVVFYGLGLTRVLAMSDKWNSKIGSRHIFQTQCPKFWDNPITIGFAMSGVMFGLLGLVRYLR